MESEPSVDVIARRLYITAPRERMARRRAVVSSFLVSTFFVARTSINPLRESARVAYEIKNPMGDAIRRRICIGKYNAREWNVF